MASGKHGHTIHLAGSTTGATVLDESLGVLSTAVVHRACVDYLMALRGRRYHGRDRMDTPEELEKFFHSPWFHALCGADGGKIIIALRRMHNAGIKTIYYTENSNEREEN